MRVLITDSNTRPALASTRSVAKAGHIVVTCGEHPRSLAGASRYSSAHETTPSPASRPREFAECVRALVGKHRIDVLLPMTEVTTLTLVGDAALRNLGVALPFGDEATVARAANKAAVLQLARSLGVPVPATVEVGQAKRFVPGDVTFAYPVVIKPARSRVLTAAGWVSSGVSYALDPDALRKRLDALPPALFPVLLQERIEGDGVGVFMCFAEGRRVATFAHRRIREMPPSGGVSVLCESCAPDPAAAAHADQLLTNLGWRGPAMVEFKRDRRDGSLRLMEINGRFWGSLQLAIDAGVDFPSLAVNIAAGRPVMPVEWYRVGVRSRWFWGDASAMLLLLTRDAHALNLPPAHPGRWGTLRQFLGSSNAPVRSDVWRTDDWRPFLLETGRWLMGR